MRCYACQEINTDSARFCVECGASLAATAWAEPASTTYAPAPLPNAPLVYAPHDAGRLDARHLDAMRLAPRPGAAPATTPYQASTAGAANSYAAYGYATAAPLPGGPFQGAPLGGPSLVNNVTVTQSAPAPPPMPAPAPVMASASIVMARRRAGVFGVLARAAWFLFSGMVAGGLWVGSLSMNDYDSSRAWAGVLALVVTIFVLLIDIMIVERLARN